jgi:thiol:disulfide interchange protein
VFFMKPMWGFLQAKNRFLSHSGFVWLVLTVCALCVGTASITTSHAENVAFFKPSVRTESVVNIPPLADELKQSNRFVLLNFYAPWCPTCQKMEPFVKALEKELEKDVLVIYLDTDVPNNRPYLKRYGVHSTPNYILFNKEGQPVYRMSQEIDPSVLRQNLYKAVKKKAAKQHVALSR